MDDNQQLKVLLHDAESICFRKLLDVIDNFGEDDPEVITIDKDLSRVFRTFKRLEIWAFPIEYDEQNIAGLILNVDDADPTSSFDFFDAANDLMKALIDDVIQEAVDNLDSISLSEFNIRAIDSVRIIRQNIANRKRFFKREGIDLNQDAEFAAKNELGISRMRLYRAMLSLNDLQATDRDIGTMTLIGTKIQESIEVNAFIFFYDRWLKYLKRKLPSQP